ncbi:MAG: VTT domain-containing protein [Patescibacteria group bacterium]
MDFILNIDLPILIQTIGYLGIFLIIFAESGLFFGFFLPGDTLLFTAGLLASQGYFDITLLVLLVTFGAVLGDQIGYLFGKKIGPKIFTRDDSFFFKKRYITDAENFYKKHGKKAIVFARFIPVVRTFIPILAGVGNMHYKTFVSYNILGGLFWGAGVTLAGYFLGQKIPGIDKYLIPILLLIVFVPMLPTLFSFIYNKIKNNMLK